MKDEDATGSFDMLPAMLGIQDENDPIRPHLLTQSFKGDFQIRQGEWKFLDHMLSGGEPGNNYSRGFMAQYHESRYQSKQEMCVDSSELGSVYYGR